MFNSVGCKTEAENSPNPKCQLTPGTCYTTTQVHPAIDNRTLKLPPIPHYSSKEKTLHFPANTLKCPWTRCCWLAFNTLVCMVDRTTLLLVTGDAEGRRR